jgi:F-type H+-transporting ATPase subunit delta
MKIISQQYAKTLYELTKDKSHKEVDEIAAEFIKLLVSKNQSRLLPKIIEKFNGIWNKENGIVEAEVISREKLNSLLVDKLIRFVKDRYRAKEVLINNIVNESIKGGIIIRVGNEVMDGSVERQLRELKSILER